jgi:hypothetical protein
MSEKQRYYASLERQVSAENSLRAAADADLPSDQPLDELYADMGMRVFTALQNCLDWLGSLGGRRTAPAAAEMGGRSDEGVRETLNEMADSLLSLREQLAQLETAMNNLEAGMRRIDKYTLDAFRQLAELDHERVEAEREPAGRYGGRRLPKEEAIRLALSAAHDMAQAGQPLSLASVARAAGLKYGQIVYAFGNKENFLAQLEAIKQEATAAPSGEEGVAEVAATADRPAAS